MVIGQSGGRSRRNATSADFRATQRERDLVDPPGIRPEPPARPKRQPVVLTPMGQALWEFCLWAAIWGMWIGLWAGLAMLVAKWFGLY